MRLRCFLSTCLFSSGGHEQALPAAADLLCYSRLDFKRVTNMACFAGHVDLPVPGLLAAGLLHDLVVCAEQHLHRSGGLLHYPLLVPGTGPSPCVTLSLTGRTQCLPACMQWSGSATGSKKPHCHRLDPNIHQSSGISRPKCSAFTQNVDTFFAIREGMDMIREDTYCDHSDPEYSSIFK